MYSHFGNQYGSFLGNWNSIYLKNSAIPLLGIYPKEAKEIHLYHKNICSTMFTAVLFVTARTWKQSRCPSSREWIKKMWYVYSVEYYSAVKNNDILKFSGKCMELEKKKPSRVR